MIIGIEWGRRSVAYERLWDIADVLGVDVLELFTSPTHAPATERQRKGRVKGDAGVRKPADQDAK